MKITSDKELEKLTRIIQQKLDGNPALLVGSGGSIPYGLPSMDDLASEITSKLEARYRGDETWNAFVGELLSSNNLEAALERVTLRDDIQDSIISIVWSLIDKKDREAINRFLRQGTSPAITSILKKSVQCAGATNIVTTNYDRLIEYAIDFSQGNIETGFSGNCIKSFRSFSCNAGKRTVNLFKVHGSIDWFRHKTDHNFMSTGLLDYSYLSDVYMPMIVTPGNRKYRETHNDPFRTVIAEADKALRGAGSYLCMGYGFNDEHIQPIIIEENRRKNKPVVIVTKDVTPKMRALFLQNTFNCLIVSKKTGGGSTVYYSNTECESFADDFWQLDLFYKLWLE